VAEDLADEQAVAVARRGARAAHRRAVVEVDLLDRRAVGGDADHLRGRRHAGVGLVARHGEQLGVGADPQLALGVHFDVVAAGADRNGGAEGERAGRVAIVDAHAALGHRGDVERAAVRAHVDAVGEDQVGDRDREPARPVGEHRRAAQL